MISFKLQEIAQKIHADLQGDPECRIYRVEPLSAAGPGAISFLANPKYQSHLSKTQASAVILRKEQLEKCSTNALIVPNPELAIAKVLSFIYPDPPTESGVHPSAMIEKNCEIDPSVSIGPNCVIEEGVCIKADTIVGAGTFIGRNVHIGHNCKIYPHVNIYYDVQVGDEVIIHSGAVIGADGFGLAHDGQKWVKIPQIGTVIIGSAVEIGANTTIDRGALQNTTIGDGVKIDNLVQVAHNVKIGDHTAIAACTAIAGSTEIGKYCMIGGGSCISGHIKICNGVVIGGMGGVARSIDEPGMYSSGTVVQKNSAWRRNMLRFNQLDEFAKRLSKLEKLYKESDGH